MTLHAELLLKIEISQRLLDYFIFNKGDEKEEYPQRIKREDSSRLKGSLGKRAGKVAFEPKDRTGSRIFVRMTALWLSWEQ